MSFVSFQFVCFLVAASVIFFALPGRYRLYFLFLASLYSYFAGAGIYLLVIMGLIVLNYFGAIFLAKSAGRKIQILWLFLIVDVGILFFFKYSGRLLNAAIPGFFGNDTGDSVGPIGLSFVTLEAVAYMVDVYLRKISPERNVFKFGLYIIFFPLVLCGPIERAGHLISQFEFKERPKVGDFQEGIKLMIWGFFKKLVIADQLGSVVDHVYANPVGFQRLGLIMAAVFFAYQIYFDFSGYTDIARGAAKLFGIDLFQNFNFPFTSKSFTEFWGRWHITLTNWLRDYLFVPLVSTLSGRVALPVLISIFVTLALSGVWHGVKLTFVVWGLLHACFLTGQFLAAKFVPSRDKIPDFVKTMIVFSLVTYSLIFFRANSLGEAWSVSNGIFFGGGAGHALKDLVSAPGDVYLQNWAGSKNAIVLDIALIAAAEAVQFLQRRRRGLDIFLNRNLQLAYWNIIVLMIIMLGQFSGLPFAYSGF